MLQHCSRLLWPMLTPGSTAELLRQYHFSVKCYLAKNTAINFNTKRKSSLCPP